MSTATIQAPADKFISAAQAIRENPGLNRVRLYRLAVTGQVRVQLIGGIPPRYSRDDVSRELANHAQGA
jgi:hypothetical protein